MSKHVIRNGLQLPITGQPTPDLDTSIPARHVALHAADYPGLKPSLRVSLGDSVVRGQLLFDDKAVSQAYVIRHRLLARFTRYTEALEEHFSQSLLNRVELNVRAESLKV